MARASKEYWAQRALQREAEAYARGGALSTKLYDAYQTALRDLRRQINDFYVRYARENRLSYEEAVKTLTRAEVREWKATLGEWVERINAEVDPKIKARLKAELDALAYRSRMDRLEVLSAQIEMELDGLYARCMREMAEEFGETYRESYYKQSFDIQQRAGRIWDVAGIDAGMVENVMSYPWSGANFSDRLWQNKAVLLFNLRQDLTQGLIKGTGIAPLSKSLSERMGQSYKAAERLVRTELNHFHNEADKAGYKAAGIEWYEFMATLDSRTCAACGALDGKHFKVSEAQTGVNYPPLHPNDRCTTVMWDPEEAEDWAAAGEKMPEGMTYEEWYQRKIGAGKSAGENSTKPDEPAKPIKPYTDITGEWYPEARTNSHAVQDLSVYTAHGITYTVDGHNVVLDYSAHEKEIAELLEKEVGGELFMVPRVNNPQGVPTPDYLFHGKTYDLKTIGKNAGVNTIFNRVKKAAGQANNFIIDVTNSGLDDDTIHKQIEKLFNRIDTNWVEEVVIIRAGEIVRVVKRA